MKVGDRPAAATQPARARRHSATGRPIACALLGMAAFANGAVLVLPDPTWACAAALLLTVAVPGGLLAVLFIPSNRTEPAEWLAAAFGLGIVALVASSLILSYLPLPLGAGVLLAWFSGLALLLAAAVARYASDWRAPRSTFSGVGSDLALILGLGSALRLPHLGYSELQGDESEVVFLALGVLQDVPEALFYHGKGPAEVLVTAVQYGLVGALSEASARLPFTLANLTGLVVVYLIARRLLGRPGALASALLLVFNGYLVAFARIVQYQSLVFLLSVLAVWCAVRWADSPTGPLSERMRNRWPMLAGTFAAVGALAHYDAVFALPPIALLALWRGGLRGVFEPRARRGWLVGGAIGLTLLLLFFGPYLLTPLYALAEDRIERRVGVGVHNNLARIWASTTFYTSVIYPILVGAFAGVGILLALRSFRTGSYPLSRAWLVGLVWFAVPFLFYAFFARLPGTHFHVASTGLALLGGWTVAALWGEWPVRVWRAGTIALFGTALALVGAYLVPLYLPTPPGPLRDALRDLSLARAVVDTSEGRWQFGFPHQSGWKVLGQLYAQGQLAGTFDSNDKAQVTHWYTRGAWRCAANPRYYLVAEAGEDEIEPRRRTTVASYPVVGVVTVGGQPRLRVHDSSASPESEPEVWPAEAFAERFDRDLSRPVLDPGPWGRGPLPTSYTVATATFGDAMRLLGYRLYAEDPRPGGAVRVDLYWVPLISTDGGYAVNLRLGADPTVGDASGSSCDIRRVATKPWTAGWPFVERASLSIAADAPTGRHPLLVGVSQAAPNRSLTPDTALPTRDGLVEIGSVEVVADDRGSVVGGR